MITYPFADDDGNVHELSFEQMMDATDGIYDLPGAGTVRRVRDFKNAVSRKPPEAIKHVSDSLGFIEEALPEKRKELNKIDVPGVEFKEDPEVKGFYQVHFSSEGAKQKYVEKTGNRDYNSRNGSGGIVSGKDIADAEEMIRRRFND